MIGWSNITLFVVIVNYKLITLSAICIVDVLCAIIIIVILPFKFYNVSFTARSDSLSSAEVASSISIIGAFLRIALAMAIRCL